MDKLELIIKEFVKHYSETRDVQNKWKEPLIAYADVCGKCLVNVPCSMTNPVK